MVTTVTNTRERVVRQQKGIGFDGKKGRGNGHGPRPPGGGNDGGRDDAAHDPSQRYRIGMWVALASILMMFTALTSAYIVRAGMSDDWQPIAMPRLLWLSTALIVSSSFTIEAARRSLKKAQVQSHQRWLFLTLLLGLGFLSVQLLAWRQLVAQGIYLATNPHSSFFYLLTGVHGLHLFGGILALNYLLLRAWRHRREVQVGAKRRTATDVVALYWHFMDGLWFYLFGLLFLWR